MIFYLAYLFLKKKKEKNHRYLIQQAVRLHLL